MKGAQKLIKVLAIALAVVIIGSLVSAIAGAGMVMSFIFGGWQYRDNGDSTENIEVVEEIVSGEIEELKIEVKNIGLEIVAGDRLAVESSDDGIRVRQEGRTLKVVEDNWQAWGDWDDKRLMIVVPDEVKELELSAGAGLVQIRDLKLGDLSLKLGAGKTEIRGIKVSNKVEIDGGAGVLEVGQAELSNLDFDMGVGKASFTARLIGNSEIDAGVGKLELRLIGDEDDYRVEAERGVGALNLKGISTGNTRGKNLVKIDGGVGAIDVELVER